MEKCDCGKPASHTILEHGGVKRRQCCECYVASGEPPADWHEGCMKAAGKVPPAPPPFGGGFRGQLTIVPGSAMIPARDGLWLIIQTGTADDGKAVVRGIPFIEATK